MSRKIFSGGVFPPEFLVPALAGVKYNISIPGCHLDPP